VSPSFPAHRFITISSSDRKWSDFAFVKRMKRSMPPPNGWQNLPADEATFHSPIRNKNHIKSVFALKAN